MDNKVEKCIFVGYKYRIKGYKLWNLVTSKIVYSRDVIFKEVKSTSSNEDESKEKGPEKIEFEIMNEGFDSFEEELSESDEEVELQTPALRRFDRVRRPIERYSPPYFHSSFGLSTIHDEPVFLKEVVSYEQCKLWKNAMVEEMEALDKNEA